MMLLSIIVPVFNTDTHYLQCCISSVQRLLSIRNDVELIVCDDGSNSDTLLFLNELKNKYHNFIILTDGVNRGQNSARNIGVKASSGKYILFLDSDDYLNVNDLILCLNHIQDIDADIFAFNALFDDGTVIHPNIEIHDFGYVDNRKMIEGCRELWRYLFRKNLLIDYPLIEGIKIGEDVISAILLLCNANLIYSFDLMPYVYRKNNQSIMNTSNPYVICQIVHGFDQLIHCLDKKLFRNYYCEIEWQAIKHIIVFESQQILRCGVRYKSLVVDMRYWMNLIFPKWQSNFYLKSQKYGLRTKAVLSGHYFLFYYIDLLLRFFNDSK